MVRAFRTILATLGALLVTNEAPKPISSLAARIMRAQEEQPGLDEVRRICRIETARRPTQGEAEEISRAELAPSWFEGSDENCFKDNDGNPIPFRLWVQQVECLLSFRTVRGGFFSIPVGSGKELASLLCIKTAHSTGPQGMAIRRSLLVVPSRVFRKLVERDIPFARRVIQFGVPVHALGGLSPEKRLTVCRSGLAGVYCTTYALLQRPGAAAELEALAPQLVVVNEAHYLLNPKAAVTRRIRKAVRDNRAAFVVLSGTISKKTFLDAHPLLADTLRDGAPVPRDSITAEQWAGVIDSDGRPPLEHLQAMQPLRDWALREVREGRIDPTLIGGPLTPDADGIARAYRARRNATPGVVANADEGALGASLIIDNRPAFEEAGVKSQAEFDAVVMRVHDRLDVTYPSALPDDFVPAEQFKGLPPLERTIALLWAVRARGLTPSGDELPDARHGWRYCFEISSGIYQELLWPEVEALAKERSLTAKEAEELLKRARAHRKAVQGFNREMRYFLDAEHVSELDTPLLIWRACDRKDERIPQGLYERWLGVRAAEFDGMPERVSNVERLSDWKVRAAVRWAQELAKEGEVGGIAWCWNVEIQQWVSEVFEETFGKDRVLRCPAGRAADARIQDPASAEKWCVASIAAHSEGKDLQHHVNQVLVQCPRSAVVMQQLLGRVHRAGQRADEVVVRTLLTCDWEHENYSAMLHDALWLSRAEASNQKAVHCDYVSMPRNHTQRFLQERGFKLEAGKGTDAAMRMLFGGEA